MLACQHKTRTLHNKIIPASLDIFHSDLLAQRWQRLVQSSSTANPIKIFLEMLEWLNTLNHL